MALAYKPKKLTVAQPPSGIVKPPTTTTTPRLPTTPAPVVKPMNTGIVKPPTSGPSIPPPVNEPVDFRRNTPTPNDKPPLSYNPGPVKTPAPIVAGEPPISPKGPMTQREPDKTIPPAGPMKPPLPNPDEPPPAGPYPRPVPPGPAPVPTTPPPTPAPTTPTVPSRPPVPTTPPPSLPPPPPNPNDPRNPNNTLPGDPSNGRGQVPDTDPRSQQYERQNETTQQRIDRLEAKLRGMGGKNPQLEARIARLKERLARGETKPYDPNDLPRGDTRQTVQLDDDPSTWTPEMLAELAPARGTVTKFYDNPNSTDKKATDPLTGKPKKGDSNNDGTSDVNEVRQGESLEQRLKRLQKKKKTNGGSPQLNKRIQALKKKLGKTGGNKNVKDTGGQGIAKTNTESAATKETKQNKTSQVPDSETNNSQRQGENLRDRLARLKEKLKTATTPEQREQLKKRIAALEARVKVGDTKGNTTDQPGTPTRPYRNRETTYKPLSYGGTLRI